MGSWDVLRARLFGSWQIRFLLYPGGLILSAFVGVLISAQAEKADVRVQVTSVTSRPPNVEHLVSEQLEQTFRGGSSSPVTVDAELKKLTSDSSWISVPSGDSPNAYLQSLLEIRTRASETLQAMKALRQSFSEWPDSYEGDRLVTVYNILRDHYAIVFAQIFGETRRDVEIFHGPKPPTSSLVRRFSIQVDEDGDFYVDYAKFRLPIAWSLEKQT